MFTDSPMTLPDPWIPWEPYNAIRSTITLSSMGHGTIFASNNDSILVPFTLPCDATLYRLSFFAANGTGNYDLALYSSELARLASTGSTAMTAAGVKSLTIPEMRFKGGSVLFAALALSNTLGQVLRIVGNLSQQRGFGVGFQASALPLPDPYVPTTPALAGTPLFAFGVR